MIARIHLLMAVWHYSAPLVHRLVLTYPQRSNGKRMTGKEEHYFVLTLTMNMLWQIALPAAACNGWEYEISASDPEATRG